MILIKAVILIAFAFFFLVALGIYFWIGVTFALGLDGAGELYETLELKGARQVAIKALKLVFWPALILQKDQK